MTLPMRREHNPFQRIATSSGPRPEPTFRDLVAGTLRHRWLVICSIVLCVIAGAAYSQLVSPVYEATSVLRFELDRINLPQLVQVLASDNMISTEIEVLQGRNASLAVVDSLGLRARIVSPKRHRKAELFSYVSVSPSADTGLLILHRRGMRAFAVTGTDTTKVFGVVQSGDTITVNGVSLSPRSTAFGFSLVKIRIDGTEGAIERFRSGLKVARPARDADLISIRARSDDPEEAAVAANLLANNVISGQRSFRQGRSSSATTFLQRQGDTLRRQLRIAEESLSVYQQREHVVDAPEQARSQVSRLAGLQANLALIRADRDAFATLIDQLRNDSTARGVDGEPVSRRLMAFPLLLQNQSASVLLGALAQVETQRAELMIRRTPTDSDVLVLTRRIRDLELQLRGIAESFQQSLANQVASLEGEAMQFSRDLDVLPERELQLARRQRDVRVLNDLWVLVETRLKESEITGAVSDPTVRLVDRAAPTAKPVRPNLQVNVALSVVFGTIVGLALALTREIGDRSVRSRADVLAAGGLPVLGALPRVTPMRATTPPWRRRQLVAGTMTVDAGHDVPEAEPVVSRSAVTDIPSLLVTQADSPPAYVEALNQLFASLALSQKHTSIKTVVFTSPLPGEGKSLSAINFALTGASRGLRILLIDGDLRRGVVSDVFGCSRSPGFAELLAGSSLVSEALRHVALQGWGSLVVVPSGALPREPSRLLTLDRVNAVVAALAPAIEKARVDYVVIDTPPVNILADAAILGAAADAVILVARAGHTTADSLRHAKERLDEVGAPVIGTLLNDIDLKRNRRDDSYYRYIAEAERYRDYDSSSRR